LLFVTYTFTYVWCNPSACFEKVIRLNSVWLRLDYVCRVFLVILALGLYVWIRFVSQLHENKQHPTNHINTSKIVGSRLRPFVRRPFAHPVRNRALYDVWIRLRYVCITFESTLQIPENKVAREPLPNSKDSLKPFGMRLTYVSCNSIAARLFEQTHLYVSIRLVQPFHRFGSEPLRFYTFRATLPQVLKNAIRYDSFLLRFMTFVLTF
jgi:hypothetical protein